MCATVSSQAELVVEDECSVAEDTLEAVFSRTTPVVVPMVPPDMAMTDALPSLF